MMPASMASSAVPFFLRTFHADALAGWPKGQVEMTIMPASSSQNILHHIPRNIGQPEIATGVAEGELRVIKAQQMQDRRVEVVNVDGVLDRFVAVVVAAAVREAALHARAGEPA